MLRHTLRQQRLLACALLSLAVALLGVLAVYPGTALLPPCPIHQLFGVQCPGCGGTRALAALLHGHLRLAIRHNLLTVVSLPLIAGYAARAFHAGFSSVRFSWPRVPSAFVYSGIGLAAAFTLLRNL